MYKKEYKTAYYELLAKQGLSSVWLDKIINGGSRSRGMFLRPERLPMSLIVQLSFTARISIEECIETLWQHNIKGSRFFSNTEYKKAIQVVVPVSHSTKRAVIKPFSQWYPPHLRGALLAQKVYERGYSAADLDMYMKFPNTGTHHWIRKPYTISRIQDFIRMAAFLDITFTECLNLFLMIEAKEIDIPLVLPIVKNRSKNQTIASMHTFDMLRLLKDINKL
jgi:hypothetical protein